VPVMLGKDEEATTMVKLKTRGSAGAPGTAYTCEFKRHTREAGGADSARQQQQQQQQQQQAFHGIHRDVEGILAKLSGICIRKTLGYWKYELCFDNKITQSHGRDSFLLGTFSGMDGSHQLYDEGTRCEALPGNKGRESRVEFVCDSSLRLISVEEVSTCSYKIYASTPFVCGHPEFLQSTRTIAGESGGGAQAGPPRDPWFLEIAELNGGQISCSVSALRAGTDLEFSEFSLVLSASDAMLELKTELDMVRTVGRRALLKTDKHYAIRRLDENTRVELSSGRSFEGRFNMAQLQVVPVNQL